MKYSVNHKKEFENPCVVFFIGLMQFTMVLSVEVANMFVICYLNVIEDIIMNFIALQIIAEFDDFFY